MLKPAPTDTCCLLYHQDRVLYRTLVKIMIGYEVDYAAWLEEQKDHLKHQRWQELDTKHLIESLEMGDPKSELVNNLVVLIAHLLKLQVQADVPDLMKSSWYDSIDEHRDRINDSLERSKLLRNYLSEAITKAYPRARKLAIKEGQRADNRKVRRRAISEYPQAFPPEWISCFLDEDFYPS